MTFMRVVTAVLAAGAFGAANASAQNVPAAAPRPPAPQHMARLQWLAGCWELRTANRTTVEMWMAPDGNLMMGSSRTTSNGRVREFEFIRLEAPAETTLVYTAVPSGQTQTAFRSTIISDSGFTVENLQHDFPQRIIYRRRGADSLVARIEGPGQGGATRGIDFPMRRIACN